MALTLSLRDLAVAAASAAATDLPLLRAQVGGKALNLGRLISFELAVPSGFVITADAFRAFIEAAARRGLSGGLEGLAAEPVPADVEAAIRAAWATLDGPVAVRSSAVDEDGADRSFAGQQATVLGVEGVEAGLDAVRRVWASLYDPQALLYRSQQSLDAIPPAMAVVVQRQINPRAAGVCFTANPVSGADELLISAAPGLGEAVVGGQASDTCYLRKSDGAITRRELPPGASPCLSDADVARVAALATQIADRIGAPQDVEWAFEPGGGLWALQTRPITYAPAERAAEVWTNINVGEALPGVGTPMTWSIIRSFARRGFTEAFGAMGLDVPADYALVGSFRGRVYLNLSQFASIITQIPVMSPDALLAMAGGPRWSELEGTIEARSPRAFLKRLPLTIPRLLGSHLTLPLLGQRQARQLRQLRDDFHRRRLDRLSLAELADVLDEVDRIFDRTGLIMLGVSANFLSSYALTRALLQRWGGPEAATQENQLFSGLTGLRSAEPALELLRMAGELRQHPALEAHLRTTAPEALAAAGLEALAAHPGGAALRDRLEAFLREHGHRAPREAEIATPRWREDPTFLFQTLQAYLTAPWLPDPDALEREQEQQRHHTTSAIRRHFTTGLGFAFRQVLKLTQANARLREDLRACVVDTLGMYRHVFIEAGRRLAGAQLLAHPEDIFFLTHPEVQRALRGAPAPALVVRAAARRALYEAFAGMPDPPDTFTLRGHAIQSTAPEPDGPRDSLKGLPGSPGRVTGKARVIHDPSAPDAQLAPGEILVASTVDVGWTPLFLVAAGVVTAKGGPLSHACIVAREFGVPAVVSAHGAMERIATGDLLTVDGEAGVVYLSRA